MISQSWNDAIQFGDPEFLAEAASEALKTVLQAQKITLDSSARKTFYLSRNYSIESHQELEKGASLAQKAMALVLGKKRKQQDMKYHAYFKECTLL